MKKKWLQYFPLEEPRPEQVIAIDKIINALKYSNKRFFVGEFPLGIGKSAIAVTLSKYFEKEVPGSHYDKRASYIVTTQKILQQQYKEDFPFLANISAKENYTCRHRKGGIDCGMGLTMTRIMGRIKDYNCIYKQEKNAFETMPIGLTNMHYFLAHKKVKGDIEQRKLLIIDECHNMENIVVDFASLSFSRYFVENVLKIPWPRVKYMDMEKFIEWVKQKYSFQLDSEIARLKDRVERGNEDSLSTDSGMKMMKLLKDMEQKSENLTNGMKYYNSANWVMSVSPSEDMVYIKPLYASNYTDDLVFSAGDKVLLMSGTILNKDTFCKNNGIPLNDVEFLSLDSPFPVENRPIFNVGVGSMSYKNKSKTLPQMIPLIEELMDHHKDEKGIIHCHTYDNMNYLRNNIKDKRLLFHSSDDRIDTLNYHIVSNEPTILVSPSFTEGVDLYGELSRFQIIMKVPFPFLGDVYVKEKMNRVKDWYNWMTAKTIIQSTGRSVRDYKDWAVTYILDTDFNFFYNKNTKFFPKWFKDALQ